MDKKTIVILGLGVLGVVISYWKFIEWTAVYGFNPPGGFQAAIEADDFGAGLVLDLTTSLVIMVVIAIWDLKRLGGRWAAASIAATFTLGVCMGLSLYLVGIHRRQKVGATTPSGQSAT